MQRAGGSRLPTIEFGAAAFMMGKAWHSMSVLSDVSRTKRSFAVTLASA